MKQKRTGLTRRIAMLCGVLLAGVFVSWLVVLGLGISIPLDGFRQPIEAAASQTLGREVRIEGALALKPGLRPALVAHAVRVAGAAGPGELLRAGRITVQLAPAALLRGKPRGRRLLIEDASIDLHTAEAVVSGTDPAETGTGIHQRLLSATAELLAQQPELQTLVLQRVVLNIRDDSTGQAWPLKLDDVSVHTRPGQALELKLRGRFQQQPYSIDLTGGRLADLLTPTAPWPLQASVKFADARLLFDGRLEVSRQELAMAFDLRPDWPAEFARIAAGIGTAPLDGRLALRTEQGRPVLGGELQLPELDAVLRLGAAAGPAEDISAVALSVSIAGVPFHGQLRVAGQDTEAGIELALSATDADAGRLLEALTGTTAIRGRFRQVGLRTRVGGSGATGIANRVALTLQVDDAKLSYGNAEGERPVDVSLDELTLTLPAAGAMTMHARGSLLDEPFAVELTAGGLQTLLVEDSWPITLSAIGGGAVLDVSGPLALVHGNTPTRLHVGLYGQRIGGLAAWLGVSPCAASSYTLRGQLVLAEDIGRLQFLQIKTDRTRLNGELDWSGDDQIALLHAVLQLEELDPADIEALIPLIRQASHKDTAGGIAIDIPVLPAPVEIINADLELDIAHILLALVDVTEVSLSARVREGRLQRSPFHAHLGDTSYQGYLDPESGATGVVFENEEQDSTAEDRVDTLFSSAVRWVESAAIVPLRWIFKKKLAAEDPTDCQVQ